MWEKVGDRTFSGSPWDSRQPSLQGRGGGSGFWQRAADQRKNQPRTSASSLMYLATLPWRTGSNCRIQQLFTTDLLPFSTALICCFCFCSKMSLTSVKKLKILQLDQREKWLEASEALIAGSSLFILERRSSSISFGTLGLVVQMKRRSLPVGRISLSKPAEQPPLSIVRTTFGPLLHSETKILSGRRRSSPTEMPLPMRKEWRSSQTTCTKVAYCGPINQCLFVDNNPTDFPSDEGF